MKILVIVVIYNGKKWIKTCFDSLRNSSMPVDVFVVDNASTDGSLDIVRQNYPETIIAKNDKNLGFGKANNLGLAYAVKNNYDYVYLLNQDAWIFPDTLANLIQVQSKHNEYGVLSPMQMEANRIHLDSIFEKYVSKASRILSDFFLNSYQDVYEVTFVMAAHWLLPVEVIKQVGGFSPAFPHYGEDMNFIERMKMNHYHVGIVPNARGIHDRENRVVDKKHKLYRNYIFNIYIMSGFESPVKKMAHMIKKMIKVIYVEKTMVPVFNFFKTLIAYPRIKKIRKQSLSRGAFL